MPPGAPEIGDWFLIPQSIHRVNDSYPDDVTHRYIVKSSWLGPRVVLLLRSTKDWHDGLDHLAHRGACGFGSCALDQDARISHDVANIAPEDLDQFSCHEPDDDVIEWAMAAGPPKTTKRTRRR